MQILLNINLIKFICVKYCIILDYILIYIFKNMLLNIHRGPAVSNTCLSVVGGVRECLTRDGQQFSISPKMSYGVLECDILMLQNYMARFCNKRVRNKKEVLVVPDPVIINYIIYNDI